MKSKFSYNELTKIPHAHAHRHTDTFAQNTYWNIHLKKNIRRAQKELMLMDHLIIPSIYSIK